MDKKLNINVMESVYGFKPYPIDIIDYDGQETVKNVYDIARMDVDKTLRRAVSDRAAEIYRERFGQSVHQYKDLIQTAAVALLMGHTTAKGKYYRGYITDDIRHLEDLNKSAFSAINRYLYKSGIVGDNIGREMFTDGPIDIVSVLGRGSDTTSINSIKFDRYIKDIACRLNRVSDVDILKNIAYRDDYISPDGQIATLQMANERNVTTRTVQRAIKRIKDAMLEVVSDYNMDIETFIDYLQTV